MAAETQPKRKLLGLAVPVFAVAAVVFVAAIGLGLFLLLRPGSFEMKGDFVLTDDDLSVERGATANLCSGSGGYPDIGWGSAVTVYNADGRIVATGALGPGVTIDMRSCSFTFTVKEVPAGDGPYQYEIACRGKLVISEENAMGGNASSSLGDD